MKHCLSCLIYLLLYSSVIKVYSLVTYHTGAIGMQLLHDNESSQIQDAVKFVAIALDRLVAAGKSLSPPTASCRETTQWGDGQTLFKWVSLMLPSVSFCHFLFFRKQHE